MPRLCRLFLVLVAAALLLPGCATVRAKRQAKSDLRTVLDQSLLLMGHSKIRVGSKPFRSDCSGFVTACYEATELSLIDPAVTGASGTEILFKSLRNRGRILRGTRAKPGDLAFFHNTWDRNRNKLRDDRFTHVALVEKIDPDGTIHISHYVSGRVKRDVMNLKHRSVPRDPASGKVWNSYLRKGGGKVLTGQLLFRLGRPLPR